MRSLLRSLFARKAQPARAARTSRLGVERLDDRLLLSASPILMPGSTTSIPGTNVSATLDGSTLTVLAGGTGETVVVGGNSRSVQIQVTEPDGSVHGASSMPSIPFLGLTTVNVQKVQFAARGQQDSFSNLLAVPSSFNDSWVQESYSPGTHSLQSLGRLGATTDLSVSTRDGMQWLYSAQSGSWYQPGGPVQSLSHSLDTVTVLGGDNTYLIRQAPLGDGVVHLSVAPQDAGLRKVFVQDATRDYIAHGGLTRGDVLDLFTQAGQDGVVTAQELADLRSIAAATSIAMPDDVRNLAGKVVNHNVANVYFGPYIVGDLHPDSSAYQLNQLVQKWFYGAGLPLLPMGVVAGVHYTPITTPTLSNPLFGPTGPSIKDVSQGIGDSYLLSALGEVAQQTPQAIKDMFHDNGDGTWTVRFFIHGSANYVTVNNQLPVFAVGDNWGFYGANRNSALSYGGYGQPWTTTGPLWVALAEKAYAQMNQEGVLDRGPNGYSGGNSFAGTGGNNGGLIGGDPATALQQITGSAGPVAGQDAAFARAQYAAGNDVVLVASGTASDGVAANQSYAYLGVDPATGLNKLYSLSGSVIELTDAQVAQDFSLIEAVAAQAPPATPPGSLVVPVRGDGLTAAS